MECWVCRKSVETTPEFEHEYKEEKKKRSFLPSIGCLRLEQDFTVERECDCLQTHLVVMVNGIAGSAGNWRFSAKQFLERYPEDVIVHCSECNTSALTFDGVDIMGERLAEEVMAVIKRRPGLQKISFVAHSLGGLIARYAIGKLYGQTLIIEPSEGNGDSVAEGSGKPCVDEASEIKIAGLEPLNFITIATPHLGSRGHKQVPGLGSLHILEKVAPHTAWMLGRTGKHLFLTDKDNGKLPLLLQMVNDYGDIQFMSALRSFRHCVTYANTCFDLLVGWGTSSIRRQDELPKHRNLSKNDKYPHIVNVEAPNPKVASLDHEVLLEAQVKRLRTSDMEELMIRGLNKVSWERVDASFRGSKQAILAHSTIQVKNYCINSDGADVILHIIDNFLL